MDMQGITFSAAAVLSMLQPYLPLIAAKAAEKLGEELPAALGKLWAALRKRVDVKAAAKEALDDLLKDPQDEDVQAAFRVQLKKLLAEDAGFEQEMKALFEQAAPQAAYQVRDGGLAVGQGAKAVGKGGVIIEGGVKGDYIGADGKKSGE